MRDSEHAEARAKMISEQLLARDIREPRVLAAMDAVPRHQFVPPNLQEKAYGDHPLAIPCGQTISQPYMVALMTQLLRVQPDAATLEIGTGSGYQTAILANLGKSVISIERHEELAKEARAKLTRLGYANITVITGDGTLGAAGNGPYDAIMVTAGGPRIPNHLLDQLAPGGRLVCPVGTRELQTLEVVRRTPSGLEKTASTKCIFVPLVGDQGWAAEN